MNAKLDAPPKPKILEKLANSSNGVITYKELLNICGYTEKTLENNVLSIYNMLKSYHRYMNNGKVNKSNLYELEGFIEHFQTYLYLLEKNIKTKSENSILLTDIFDFSYVIEDYKYIAGFILLYNEFLKLLQNEKYVNIINYYFVDCLDIDDIYNNLYNFEILELLSLHSKNVILKYSNDEFLKYINNFSHCLSLSHLKDLDNNVLTELFKRKAQNQPKVDASNCLVEHNSCKYQIRMLPVYGQISAGQPNWAEECIEGKLPIDPNLMGIVNPEEHYFLRVNGESMNKVVRNGAFALIHKQDIVENGEIAVVLVNGYDATLKKFTKQGDLIILEPQSDDESFKTQVYDKNTPIKVLGKYVGKMEFNK